MLQGFGTVPFLPLLLSLISGIGVQLFFTEPVPFFSPWVFLAAGILISFIARGLIKKRFGINYVYFMLLPLHFLLGYYSSSFTLHQKADDFFASRSTAEKQFLELRLTEPVAPKSNTWRATAEVLSVVDSSGKRYSSSGKILVYWPKRTNSDKPELNYGDIILCPDISMVMPSSAFPDDFDFKAVMRYRNVQHQIFLTQGSYRKTGQSRNILYAAAYHSRDWVITVLKKGFDRQHAALLSSLLIGYKDEMDADSLKAFSMTGTMHVLAVSGMHVGLIYLALLLFFTGKTKGKLVRNWQGLMIILLLWMYALITGLSASVFRAALMFSIIEAGRIFLRRESFAINSVLAAAYVQLLISPLNLIDVGFQLSYLAVLGILLIYPLLTAYYMPSNRVGAWVWQLSMVSVAATIGTFPVSLYFFHQFPLLFLPANLLIVPISTLIIFAGIAYLFLHPVIWIGNAMAWVIAKGMDTMTGLAEFIASQSWSVITGINTDVADVLLMYLITGLLVLFVSTNGRKYVLLSLTGVLVFFFGRQAWIQVSDLKKNELIVCELKNQFMMVVRQGNHMDIITNPLDKYFADSLYQFTSNYRLKNGIKSVKWQIRSKGWIKLKDADLKVENSSSFSRLLKNGRPYAVVLWLPDTTFTGGSNQFAQYRYRRYFRNEQKIKFLRNNFVRLTL